MTISPYAKPHAARPCQGSIYREIRAIVPAAAPSASGEVVFDEWVYPYAVVISQECDLDQDEGNRRRLERADAAEVADQDKIVPTVLMCPAYQAALFRKGEHLEGRIMQRHSSDPWKLIKTNQNPRYHFLAEWPACQVAELVVDFKHFFSIPTDLLRGRYSSEEHHIARLRCPYREHLSQRFASYLARIGLPLDHHEVKAPA